MNLKYSLIELYVQQELVNTTFPDFKTSIKNGILTIDGKLSNNLWSDDYTFSVKYHSREMNKVVILTPNVVKHPDLHISDDGVLCLYYPPHISKFRYFFVNQDLIFQTIKWVYCYELWKINGHKWKCDEMPHDYFTRIGRWL